MSESEIKRKELIEDLQKEVNKEISEILYEINNLAYNDVCYNNKIDARVVWNCDEITRTLDRYRRDLDELNGIKNGMYPWA